MRRDTRRAIPTAATSGPKRGRVLPKILSVAEVDRLIATAAEAAGNGWTPVPAPASARPA